MSISMNSNAVQPTQNCLRHAAKIVLASAAMLTASLAAQAQSTISDASALSLLPIAVSIAAPATLISAGAALTVVSVEASAEGTICVLERASDGARASLRLSGVAIGAVSMVAGTAVLVTAISTGWVLSAAGHAIAFIPNEIGAALLYNERLTR